MWSSDDLDTLKQNAFKLCQDYLEGPWQDIPFKDFKFSVVSGGLSNRLYYCSLPEEHRAPSSRKKRRYPSDVLLRIYGPLQEDTAIMVREASVFTLLSEKRMGPKLYGIFSEGRLEEYIPSRSANRSDLRINSVAIAKELAKVHCLDVPISKRANMFTELADTWFCDVEENVSKNKAVADLCESIVKKEYRRELRWMINLIEKKEWPIVFCHNDLQGGNILVREDKAEDGGRSLLLIDFEFGCYNYRGFDIGNHFCEWCFNYNTKEFPFFEVDLSKFPNQFEQVEFIDAYLEEVNAQTSCYPDSHALAEEKRYMLQEVMIFRMVSSLLWSLWSIKMALSSNIQFGFPEYGKCRWDTYKQHKEEFLRWAENNTNGELKNGDSSKQI